MASWIERAMRLLRRVRRRRRARASPDPRRSLRGARDPASFESRWARLTIESITPELLGELTGGRVDDLDAGLCRLLPRLAGKRIADLELTVPPSLPFEAGGFPLHVVTLPIDWSADPLGDRDWRLWFQSLAWIDGLYRRKGKGLWRAAYAVVDWQERVLAHDPPFAMTWDSHAMAARLDRVWRFLQKYIDVYDPLDRRTLRSAVTIVLSHLYGLAVDCCYVPGHNHGLMQDRSLLVHASRMPALLDGPALVALAERRLVESQVKPSVTSDFIHMENSPSYQLLFVRLLTKTIADGYFTEKRTPPSELVRARDQALETFVHLTQPDRTVAPFGDSLGHDVSRELRLLLRSASRSVPVEPGIESQVRYVASAGASGTPPPDADRVFLEGGYASFREGWGGADPSMNVSAHFKCRRQSRIHYHQDDTSIVIYGFGRPLVSDPGRYSNDRSQPLARLGAEARSHNLLIVNGENFGPAAEPSRVLAGGSDPLQALAWVQGTHGYWARQGVERYVRTFAYCKPRSFLVLDALRSSRDNVYAQHFHLHPSLVHCATHGDLVITALRDDGSGLVLVSCDARGGLRASLRESNYFPREHTVARGTEIVLERRLPAGTHHLPVFILLSGPGEEPEVPEVRVTTDAPGVHLEVHGPARDREIRLPIRAI